jgi:hypothetical protein
VLGRSVPEGILQGLARGPKQIPISYLTDDVRSLESFHRRAVEQCYQRVFCSSAAPNGITVKDN